MKNRKQLLADFYLELLAIQYEPSFNLAWLINHVKTALAKELETEEYTVQNIFERMASEDK